MGNDENGQGLILPTGLRVLLPNGKVEEMKLETYLAGVVAAEIGADAPLEALKAQAVASRTYVATTQRHPEHNADVCTTAHCQKWKRIDPVGAPEVFRALSETWGMVATHEGQLISAFFFEHCDGHTRNAEEMHIPGLAYLRGVDCSCGFLTLKGHGVGMCKRGAIMMARRNASFEQILQHYYRGISIVRTTQEMPVEEESTVSQVAPVEPERPAAESPAIEPPAAPKPRTRARKTPAPPADASEPPKPKRRYTRRARVTAAPPAPQPIIEITAIPASVALKRIQIPVSDSTVEPAQASAPAIEEPVRPPQSTAPKVAELAPPQSAAPTIQEPAPSPQPTEPVVESEPPRRRLELDFPAQEPAPVPAWRLAQAEPIELTHVTPAHIDSSEPVVPAPQLADMAMADDTPSIIARRIHVDHLPGERMICGAMPRAGIVVMIQDPHGEHAIVYSGNAAHYGEGGFEMAVPENGKYLVTIGGRGIEVQVEDDTVFIHA